MKLYSRNLDGIVYPIRAIEALAEKYGKEKKLFHLNIGDPVRLGMHTPRVVCDAAAQQILAGKNFYSPSNGCVEAREAVARFYNERNIHIMSDDVYMTSGVTEAINLLYLSLFNRGESIALPRPYYPLYENLARLYSLRINFYDLDENGYPDIERLERSMSKKTKAVVLINPNNPMGSNLNKKMLDEVKETVLSRGSILISDEIYSEMAFDGNMSYAQAGSEEDRVITLGGISKSHRVPGWRLGWAVFGRDKSLNKLRENFEKLLQLRLSSPAPFQYALPHLLFDRAFLRPYMSALMKNAAIVQKRVRETDALSVNKIDAALYAFLKMNWRQKSSSFVADLIKNQGVVAVPGSGFGREGYFRIVFAGSRDDLEEAMDRIVAEADKKYMA